MAEPLRGGVPEFMYPVVGETPTASARDVAEHAVLALNPSMLTLYDESLEKFKQNMRDRVPIILALFTGAGRADDPVPARARPPKWPRPVPIVYQLAKSVGHSSMAIYQVVPPYLADPWPISCGAARCRCTGRRTRPPSTALAPWTCPTTTGRCSARILERNLAFMDECLAKGGYTLRGRREVHPQTQCPTRSRPSASARAPRWATG